MFDLVSKFIPGWNQLDAIKALVVGINNVMDITRKS